MTKREGKREGKRVAWGRGRMAFNALAPQILQALEQNAPLSIVYAQFSDRLEISYRQFCRWVAVHRKREQAQSGTSFSITMPPKATPSPLSVGEPAPASKGAHEPKQYREENPKKGFHFDPMDAVTKKFT